MSHIHATSVCPLCKEEFICKAGIISQCECFSITLSDKTREILREKYDECLCVKCLKKLEENDHMEK